MPFYYIFIFLFLTACTASEFGRGIESVNETFSGISKTVHKVDTTLQKVSKAINISANYIERFVDTTRYKKGPDGRWRSISDTTYIPITSIPAENKKSAETKPTSLYYTDSNGIVKRRSIFADIFKDTTQTGE